MKLGLVCSPSLITGEPVASKRSIVSRSAASYCSSSSACDAPRATASISSGGRGMLPIGSVGIAMGRRSAAHDLLLVLQDPRLVVLHLLLVRQDLVELPLVLLDVLLVPQDVLLVLD